MSLPPEAQKGEGRPGPQNGDLRQTCRALVHEMAERLTAISNYLEAATRLRSSNTPATRMQLDEVMGKGLAEVLQANEVLRQMRETLEQK